MKRQPDPFTDDGRKSPFDALNPDLILQAAEELGFDPTGELVQLNSYENRVFEIKLEPSTDQPSSVIAKFYRPGRWTEATIREEHHFLQELKDNDIPAVCPFDATGSLHSDSKGAARTTVLSLGGFYVGVFPKVRARMPDEFLPGDLREIGKTLARLHNVGAQRPAPNRPVLNSANYGDTALDRLQDWVFPDLWPRYVESSEVILEALDERLRGVVPIRIHGDCHRGNILKSDPSMAAAAPGTPLFFFVDFDDFCVGPEVQDFFMLLSSRLTAEDSAQGELEEILSGYSELRAIPKGLRAIEALQGLRIIHYSGWIAARWSDPAFRPLLPDFNTYEWWLDETQRLEEIADSLMDS